MRIFFAKVVILLGSLASSIALAVNYECLVTEEEEAGSKSFGTMNFDTQTEDVAFVAIDKYLFSACLGGTKSGNGVTFFTCAFVVETTDHSDASLTRKLKMNLQNGIGVYAQDVRSITLLPETVGTFASGYRRNSRFFQTTCQQVGTN